MKWKCITTTSETLNLVDPIVELEGLLIHCRIHLAIVGSLLRIPDRFVGGGDLEYHWTVYSDRYECGNVVDDGSSGQMSLCELSS